VHGTVSAGHLVSSPQGVIAEALGTDARLEKRGPLSVRVPAEGADLDFSHEAILLLLAP